MSVSPPLPRAPQAQVPPDDLSAPASRILESRSKKRALLDELSQSYAAGAPLKPEDLLARWPTDPKKDPDIASILFENWLQEKQIGKEPSLDEITRRLPEQRDSLRQLLNQHDVIHSLGGSCPSDFSLALPDVGDELFGFRLRQELGRGAFARVFLGEQAELAGRPVVLKVSRAESSEPQTLAQLQHTNIVPIYSLHEDAKAGLRLVCMPYFGGASLAHVLRSLRTSVRHPATGTQLAVGLRRTETVPEPKTPGEPPPSPAESVPTSAQAPFRQWARLSYLQAAVWVTARIADALEHAHRRGILHRDVKPSNILLASDGEPLLLDFNLAEKTTDGARAALGGTVAYMAPEHLRAMAARNPVMNRQVDRRADIYSLGMVLFEMIIGERPFEQSASYAPLPAMIEAMAVERSRATPSARKHRPDVPWSLESIVRKCLAPEPANRYQDAGAFAEDLRAFLNDQPLRHAPELSRLERMQKWARRHPRLATAGAVATVAAVLLGSAGLIVTNLQRNLHTTQEELSDAGARERQQAYDAGALRAMCLVNTTTDWAAQRHIGQGIAECEQTLGLYEVLTRDDWQDREDWRRLVNDDRREVTRELLLLLARGRVQKSPGDRAALQDALALLTKAEKIENMQPTPALWEDRADYLVQLGDAEGAEAARARGRDLPPASARDFYLLATTMFRREGAANPKVLEALDEAVNRNPKHYWTFAQRGAVHMDRGEWLLAARDFGVCKGIWPESPLAYVNLAFVYLREEKFDDALAECNAAIARDADFMPAYTARAEVYAAQKKHAEALADFERVAELGRNDAPIWSGRGVALEGLARHAEADTAFAKARGLGAAADAALQRRLKWVYAFAISDRAPEQARTAFHEVLTQAPETTQALYGLGMLAAKKDRLDEAVEHLDQALLLDAGFLEARRYRAILNARRGKLNDACYDINWCLDRKPKSGGVLYAAACVASLCMDRQGALNKQEAAEQASALLRRAFELGYGRDVAESDPDLEGLRQFPVFQRIMKSSSKR